MHLSHARLLVFILINPVDALEDCIEAFIEAFVPAKFTAATSQHVAVVATELVNEIFSTVV